MRKYRNPNSDPSREKVRFRFVGFLLAGAIWTLALGGCEKPASRSGASAHPADDPVKTVKTVEPIEPVEGIAEPGRMIPDSDERDSGKRDSSVRAIPLPVDRLLRNQEGRELDVTIVGRSSTHLTVVRKADSSRFEIPIETLSIDDQVFARSLRTQLAPVEREEPKLPPYITSRLEQIARLEDKVIRLQLDLKGASNPTMQRTYEEQLKRRKAEIADMENDIQRYELDTKQSNQEN